MSAKTVNKKDNQARAILRYLRMSQRKVRAASGGLRNKWVFEAEEILTHRTRRASAPLLKLLGSATANAVKNKKLNKEDLFISDIFVDGGPIFSKYMPRARGSAAEIQKKTSHVTIILGERKAGPGRKSFVPFSPKEEVKQVDAAEEKSSHKKPEGKNYAPKVEKVQPKKGFGNFGKRIFSRKAI